MRFGAVLPFFFAVLGICAAEISSGFVQDAHSSRKLLQFQEQVLPAGFKIPELTCERAGPYPYMASLRDKAGNHLCGGIVISKEHVLTAAHCIDPRFSRNSNPRPLIHIGGWDRDNPVEKRNTRALLPHPEWRGDPFKGADLAILTLDEPTCAKPIFKVGKNMAERTFVEFLGFGRSSIGGTFSFLLQGGNYTFIPKEECEKTFDLPTELSESMLCAKSPNSAGICVGDDGGPLILRPSFMEFKDTVLGIASFSSTDCTDAEGVSIFTNLKHYRSWIIENSSAEEERKARAAAKRKARKEKKAAKEKNGSQEDTEKNTEKATKQNGNN